ncbi:hypothetical protein [Aeromicrobium sp. UBA7512]|uniref:hypothetical protein n=1 Tax=Aeromicrobium sp. UBA7512 TaxID=1945962 RepID=UPI0025806682|nr:hypothetical protein [Aeromicrobium sp. UBA7512]
MMFGFGRSRQPREFVVPPDLAVFDGGLAVLSRDGEFAGHVASEVWSFVTPFAPRTKQPWVWFVIVWQSGEKETKIEEYPPWTYVAEMLDGFIELDGDRYGIDWVAAELVPSERERIGIRPEDF